VMVITSGVLIMFEVVGLTAMLILMK